MKKVLMKNFKLSQRQELGVTVLVLNLLCLHELARLWWGEDCGWSALIAL